MLVQEPLQIQEPSTPIQTLAPTFREERVVIVNAMIENDPLLTQECSMPIQEPASAIQEISIQSPEWTVQEMSIQEPESIIQEMQIIITNSTAEKDQLEEELHYARSVCAELHSLNEHLQKLLGEAQAALPPKKDLRPLPSTTWLGGTWLSPSPQIPALEPVLKAWLSGKTQYALALLTEISAQEDLPPNDRIEAGLLISTIMRSSGELTRAATYAEISLSIAQREQMHELKGKAQFHRGLSYFYLDRYADARWCFVLASHTRGHHEMIEINMQMAKAGLENLPPGHPGASLSLKF